jgi:hypothetical protein
VAETYRYPPDIWTAPLTGAELVPIDGGSVFGTQIRLAALSQFFNLGPMPVPLALLPASVRTLPLAFAFSGQPLVGQMIHLALVPDMPLSIAAGFVNTVVYVATNPTATAVFTLSFIRRGLVRAIGTVSIAPAGTFVLAAAAYTSAVGDVLRLTAPAVLDATLADICITVEAERQ